MAFLLALTVLSKRLVRTAASVVGSNYQFWLVSKFDKFCPEKTIDLVAVVLQCSLWIQHQAHANLLSMFSRYFRVLVEEGHLPPPQGEVAFELDFEFGSDRTYSDRDLRSLFGGDMSRDMSALDLGAPAL